MGVLPLALPQEVVDDDEEEDPEVRHVGRRKRALFQSKDTSNDASFEPQADHIPTSLSVSDSSASTLASTTGLLATTSSSTTSTQVVELLSHP